MLWDRTPGRTRGRKLQAIRKAHFAAHPLCVICQAEGRIVAATELDHITALANGGKDDGPRQGLCRQCHATKTRRDLLGDFFDAAFPVDLKPVLGNLVIVCGPPGSGKSTYVAAHAKSGDLVLDLDCIVAEMTGKPIFHSTKDEVIAGLRERNRRLKELSTVKRDAWLIISGAGQESRDRWSAMLKASRVVVMRTTYSDCLKRIKADTRRSRARYQHRVQAWFRREERCEYGADGNPIDHDE